MKNMTTLVQAFERELGRVRGEYCRKYLHNPMYLRVNSPAMNILKLSKTLTIRQLDPTKAVEPMLTALAEHLHAYNPRMFYRGHVGNMMLVSDASQGAAAITISNNIIPENFSRELTCSTAFTNALGANYAALQRNAH